MIFFDRDSDKKIEIIKKFVYLYIKFGEVVEVNFFRCKLFCIVYYGILVLVSIFFCFIGCRFVY